MTLTGAAAGNYTVTQPTLTANITAKTLTVSGASGVNKIYNGTTAATITGGALVGVVGSDVVNLATATSGIFASSNVGTNISITSAMTLTGAAAGNYALTQPTLTANITAKTLTVSGASGVNKVYDGTTTGLYHWWYAGWSGIRTRSACICFPLEIAWLIAAVTEIFQQLAIILGDQLRVDAAAGTSIRPLISILYSIPSAGDAGDAAFFHFLGDLAHLAAEVLSLL